MFRQGSEFLCQGFAETLCVCGLSDILHARIDAQGFTLRSKIYYDKGSVDGRSLAFCVPGKRRVSGTVLHRAAL